MNIYKLDQSVNNGYDTYDSAIVYAETAQEAKTIDPSGYYKYHNDHWYFQYSDGGENREYQHSSWVSNLDDIIVTHIGTATDVEAGLILASFNAG